MTLGLLVRSALALLVSALIAMLALNHAAVPPVSAIDQAANGQSNGPTFNLQTWLHSLERHVAAPSPTPPTGAAGVSHTRPTPAPTATQPAVVIKPGLQLAQNADVPGHIFYDTPTHNIAFVTGRHYARLFTGTGDAVAPALSADGSKLAWVYLKRNYSDIWITDLTLLPDGTVKATASISLTQDENPPPSLQVSPAPAGYQPSYEWWATKPSWMPDGQHLLYISDRPGYDPNYPENAVMSVYQQSISDTMASATRLTVAAPGTGGHDSPEWRPHDPSTFIYVNYTSSLANPAGQGVIEVNSALTGTATQSNPIDLTPQGVTEYHPAWSPDGRYIAFVEDKGANVRSDLRVMPFTPPGHLADYNRVVTVETGSPYVAQPFWSPDGRYLGYLRSSSPSSGFVMVIRRVYHEKGRLRFGPPRVLSQAGAVSAEYRPSWGP